MFDLKANTTNTNSCLFYLDLVPHKDDQYVYFIIWKNWWCCKL